MNTARARALRGRWPRVRTLAKQRWTRLSDEDLSGIDGRAERLTSRLQSLYGLERVEARQQVLEWLRTLFPDGVATGPDGPPPGDEAPGHLLRDAGAGSPRPHA
ncbi:MAG: hypothetical protein AB7H88_07860 [Vicinamibacterales bacterium]